jgi:cytidine deaminase
MRVQVSDADLIRAARQAAVHSYAPYSRFAVGAALLTTDGMVFTGCNVENGSYGLTVCAERAAVISAVGAGHRRFAKLAVAGETRGAAAPCGACLQVLAEFCGRDFPIVLASLTGPSKPRRWRLGQLLPHPFALKERP